MSRPKFTEPKAETASADHVGRTVKRRPCGMSGTVQRHVGDRYYVKWQDGSSTWCWTDEEHASQQRSYGQQASNALARLDAIRENPDVDYQKMWMKHHGPTAHLTKPTPPAPAAAPAKTAEPPSDGGFEAALKRNIHILINGPKAAAPKAASPPPAPAQQPEAKPAQDGDFQTMVKGHLHRMIQGPKTKE